MGELLEEAAQEWGDREAVVSSHQGIRKTFSQVGNIAIVLGNMCEVVC